MINYIVIHNKHEGCYDFHCYQDEAARIRLTSITINPPKIYMFKTREEAQDFFEEYINDVDCIDIRCKRGDDVEHIDYCTCGVIELDERGEPVLFYNKKNQIFLLEQSQQLFMPNQELKNDIRNLNLTNRLIRKCKSLGREQRKRYIELGKYCEECNAGNPAELPSDSDDESSPPPPPPKRETNENGANSLPLLIPVQVLGGGATFHPNLVPLSMPLSGAPPPTQVQPQVQPPQMQTTEQKPKPGRKKKQEGEKEEKEKKPKTPRKKKGDEQKDT